MSKKNKKPEMEIADVERLTYEAMRHHGLIPPMTLDEVARVETELDGIELPFSQSDPAALLKQLDENEEDGTRSTLPFNVVDTDTVRNLARAAREGGELSTEIESRMEDDKSRHQQQATDEDC